MGIDLQFLYTIAHVLPAVKINDYNIPTLPIVMT